MKKTILLWVFLFVFRGAFTVVMGQTTCTFSSSSFPFGTAPCTYQFGLTSNCSNPAAIYLFGDGHFSNQPNPVHQFHSPLFPNTTATEVFAVGPYKSSRPTLNSVFINQTMANVGSGTANPWLGGKLLHIGESWSAAIDNELIYMISFTNPCDTSESSPPVQGSLEFHVDSNVNLVNIYNPRQDWTTPFVLSSSTEPGFKEKLTWDFYQLYPGEVRHVYVHIEIPPTFNKRSVLKLAKMEAFVEEPTHSCLLSEPGLSPIRRYPHDPNSLEVNFDCVKSSHWNSQELEYTVHFQNSGAYFAKDVEIDVRLTGRKVPLSSQLLTSSAPCKLVETGKSIKIFFDSIFLPGSNQTVPYSYSYDQTKGFATFSVCIEPNLAPGELILGEAEIFFDAQPGILTNQAQTIAEAPCPIAPPCRITGGNFEKVGEGDKGEGGRGIDNKFKLDVYPNPFSHQFTVQYTDSSPGEKRLSIRLISASGSFGPRELYSGIQSKEEQVFTFSEAELPAGVYFLQVIVGNSVFVKKLVKVEENIGVRIKN